MDSWLICYDICDPKRLRKVARTCQDFGGRRQLSVFLMRLSPTAFQKLRARLHELIDHRTDQILLWPLCAKCVHRVEALGRSTPPVDQDDVVVVL